MRRELSLANEEELLPDQIDQIYQRTLGDIEARLQATGHHLSEFPSLPLLYPTHNSYKTMINRHHFIIIIIINAIRPMSQLCGISIFRICSV